MWSSVALSALLALLLLPPFARALNVGGTIASNTTWTTNDSPYVLTSALTVQSGALLTIEPGVAVQFRSNVLFTIRGAIHAEGTAAQPISFLAAPAFSPRGGIHLAGSNFIDLATGEFSHCDFTRLRATPAILTANFATLAVMDSVFSNMTAVIIRPMNSRIAIHRNEIHDTMESINTLYCAGVIASNFIHTVNGNSDAIDIDFGWTGPGDASLLLEWNHVRGGASSNADGIDFGTTRDVICRYNVIHDFGDKGMSIGEDSEITAYNNLIYKCLTGIAIKDGSRPLLMSTTIARCAIGIHSFQKSGGNGGGRGSATNMLIWNCDTGIKLDPLSQIDVGYSVIPGASVWPGPGNTNADPLFVDAANNNYRLRPGSSAIDAGLVQPWMAGMSDIIEGPRVVGPSVECGAYEYTPGPPLTIGFFATPFSGIYPLTAVFTATIGGSDSNGVTYAWDFDGDGTNDATGIDLATITNVYTVYGLHSPSLTVSNAIGESAIHARPDYIFVDAPDEVFVSPAGAHQPPFTNWASAATNVQDVLPYAFGGTIVWVTAGTYRATGELLIDDARLRGAGATADTVLQGNGTTRVARLVHTNSLLQGFTVTGGRAATAGGILLERGLVQNCIVAGNMSTNEGGGIEARVGTTIDHCVITNNRTLTTAPTGDGGGVYLYNGGTLLDSLIAYNRAGDDGGGVMCRGAGTVRRTLIRDNDAFDKGGGLFLDATGGLAESCLAVSNRAALGGGVTCNFGGRFENCTVTDNRATSGGGGLYAQNGGGSSYNTIYFGNTAAGGGPNTSTNGGSHTFAFCTLFPLVGDSSNSTNDPRFANFAAHDLRLATNSPCIDGGTNRAQSAQDIDLAIRPLDGDADGAAITDVGAYESFNAAGDTDGDGMPDGWEVEHAFSITNADGAADQDRDGFRNYAEYVAGTDPTNTLDYLRISAIEGDGGTVQLFWPTVSNRVYSVLQGPTAPDSTSSNMYQVGGTGGTQSYSNENTASSPWFWRIEVELD